MEFEATVRFSESDLKPIRHIDRLGNYLVSCYPEKTIFGEEPYEISIDKMESIFVPLYHGERVTQKRVGQIISILHMFIERAKEEIPTLDSDKEAYEKTPDSLKPFHKHRMNMAHKELLESYIFRAKEAILVLEYAFSSLKDLNKDTRDISGDYEDAVTY